MNYNNILISYFSCILLTIVLIYFTRPVSTFFFQILVLQSFAFALMGFIRYLLNRYLLKYILVNYLISFIVAYLSLLIIIWKINGGEFIKFVVSFHLAQDYLSCMLPFILSNVGLMLWWIVKIKLIAKDKVVS